MQPLFLSPEHLEYLSNHHSTPCYIYNEELLYEQAKKVLAFPHPYGLTVRYAMKANANKNILRIYNSLGIHIDASSGYEVLRALDAGIPGEHIQLSWQELIHDMNLLGVHNIQFVATSLHQLETYGQMYPWTSVWIRFNPGIGSGAFKKIDTWWPSSSFGIWHEHINDIQDIISAHNLNVDKIHIHIWSENTAEARSKAAKQAIHILEYFPSASILNLWWWFKIALMPYEKDAELQEIWNAVKKELEIFAFETWRHIHLEIEPWKYLVMNSCSLLAKVIDKIYTGKDWYTFIKTNTGMTELPRVSMYGIQQPLHTFYPSRDKEDVVVVGHCCESGDLLTCMLYQSDTVEPISLPIIHINEYIIVQSCGAYNASMAMKHYNSYPEAEEILYTKQWTFKTIRKRQEPHMIRRNEVDVI